jgi:cell wall-associated NlpC family hydrolase
MVKLLMPNLRAIDPTARIDTITFRGLKVSGNLAEAVESVTFSAGMDQVSELAIVVNDPEFKFMRDKMFTLGTSVRWMDWDLSIVAIETDGGPANRGQVTVRARSSIVKKLRDRRGPLVVRKASPTDFVLRETRAVGGRLIYQATGKRSQVSRDVVKSGERYGVDIPSSWTTFGRLAREVGYAMFETAGLVYFVKPSFLLRYYETNPGYNLYYNTGPVELRTVGSVPRCRWSSDSNPTVQISLQVPSWRANEFKPGTRIKFWGMHPFDSSYLVTDVTIPIGGPGIMDVSLARPADPVPEPPEAPASTTVRTARQVSALALQDPKRPAAERDGVVVWGDVSAARWQQLINAGWRGSATDNREALYAPGYLPATRSTPSTGGATKSALDFVSHALRQIGDRYVYGAEANLNSSNPTAWDCSELVQWAAHRTGVYIPDGSANQLAYCRSKGTIIGVATAMRTRGALLFHPGHVAISLGNGRTVEAANSRSGVVSYGASGRFSSAAKVPGMRY